jgi:hypothetical protein
VDLSNFSGLGAARESLAFLRAAGLVDEMSDQGAKR